MNLHFLMSGDINEHSSHNIYNNRIIQGLLEKGYNLKTYSLGNDFPFPSDNSIQECIKMVQSIPKSEPVIFDGKALAAIPFVLKDVHLYNPVIALVHIPLSADPQYSAYQRTMIISLEKEAFGYADMFIATSSFTVGQIQNFDIHPDKIKLIIPGVDECKQKQNYPEVPVKLLSVANLSRNRDHSIMIKALTALKNRNWVLNCYGNFSMDKEYISDLKAMIKRKDLEEKISFHENITGQSLSEVYLNADLFVHPSDFESYGMALTEALVHGIPVVASTGGGIRNTVPTNMGELFKPGDVYGLQSILEELFDNPLLYKRLYTQTATYYKVAHYWRQSIELFEEVVKGYLA